MFDNEIYEVTRNEYAGYVRQLKPQSAEIETIHQDNYTIIKLRSIKTGTHLATRIISEQGEEQYYIFNMPDDDERVPATPVRQVVLETREEVEHFFKALSQLNGH